MFEVWCFLHEQVSLALAVTGCWFDDEDALMKCSVVLVLALCCVSGVFGLSDFVKSSHNPLFSNSLPGECAQNGEATAALYNGSVFLYYRTCNGGNARIFYATSRDGESFVQQGEPDFGNVSTAFVFPSLFVVTENNLSVHHLIASQSLGNTFLLRHWVSFDMVHWQNYCIVDTLTHGALFNPTIAYDNVTKNWSLLVEHDGYSGFSAYTSRDGCSWDFLVQNIPIPGHTSTGGESADLHFVNGTYVLFYSDFSSGTFSANLAVGPDVLHLRDVDSNILCGPTQGWEWDGQTDTSLLVNDDPSSVLNASLYLYYTGNQAYTGVGVERDNQSLSQIITGDSTRVCQPTIPGHFYKKPPAPSNSGGSGSGGGGSTFINRLLTDAEKESIADRAYLRALYAHNQTNTTLNATVLLNVSINRTVVPVVAMNLTVIITQPKAEIVVDNQETMLAGSVSEPLTIKERLSSIWKFVLWVIQYP